MENKMTPTPWKGSDSGFIRGPKNEIVFATKSLLPDERQVADMSAAVSAVNFIYGKGIDPSSVPELLDALKELRAVCVDSDAGNYEKQKAIDKAKAAIDKAIIKP